MILHSFLLLLTLHHTTAEDFSDESSTELAPPLFCMEHYNNTCKRNEGESFDSKNCGDLIDFCPLFHDIMLEAMEYACTGNISAIQKISGLNLLYKRKFDNVHNKTLSLVSSLLDIQHVLQVLVASRQLRERFNALGTLSLTSIELGAAARTGYDSKNALSKYFAVEKKILDAAKIYLSDAYVLKRNVEMNRLSAVFTTDFYQEKLHLHIIPYVIHKSKQKVLAIEEALPAAETTEVLRTCVFPTILWAEFIVGIAGNGLMMVIMVKHSVMRKLNYIMLTSLWVINTFSLLINLPFVVATINHPWKWNLALCQMFWFLRKFAEFVSTYSVVILSYQRFQMVYRYTGRQTLSDNAFLMILTVFLWFLGILFALPETVFSNVAWDRCLSSEFSLPYIAYIRMMVVCLTPLCPLIVFPVLVSMRLKQNAAPCESSKDQTVSCGTEEQPIMETRALVVMIMVLLLTYIPSTIFHLAKKQAVTFGLDSFKELIQLSTATNLMDSFTFLNCALNPLILVSLSEEFKMYFIGLFTCCRLYRVNQKCISKPV